MHNIYIHIINVIYLSEKFDKLIYRLYSHLGNVYTFVSYFRSYLETDCVFKIIYNLYITIDIYNIIVSYIYT